MAVRRVIDRPKPEATIDQEKKLQRKKILLMRLGKIKQSYEQWQRKLRRAFKECEKQRQVIKRITKELEEGK